MKEILNYENGKYTVETDGVRIYAYRYNDSWQDFTGNRLIAHMLNEIQDLREEVRLIKMGE